jgi:hypothetical protein
VSLFFGATRPPSWVAGQSGMKHIYFNIAALLPKINAVNGSNISDDIIIKP